MTESTTKVAAELEGVDKQSQENASVTPQNTTPPSESGEGEKKDTPSTTNTESSADGVIRSVQNLLNEGKEVPKAQQWALKYTQAPVENDKGQKLSQQEVVRDIINYEKKMDEIKAMKLSEDKQKDLDFRYNSFISKGFSQTEAIEMAAQLAGATNEIKEAEKRGKQMSDMANPNPGSGSAHDTEFDYATASEDEVLEHIKKVGVIK